MPSNSNFNNSINSFNPNGILPNGSGYSSSSLVVHNSLRSPNQQDSSYYGPRTVDNRPAWLQQREDAISPPGGHITPAVTVKREEGQTDGSAPSVPKPDQRGNKKRRLWVLLGQILSTGVVRAMPLALDNDLPAVELQFGSSDDDEICFCCHLDICAAMNTGNLLLHMWIMTKFPYLVSNFE